MSSPREKTFSILPTDLDVFVSRPIGSHVERFLSHGPAFLGIKEHDIGITAGGDTTFLRSQPEEPSRSGSDKLYELS